MPKATLPPPPSVPRSSVAGLIAALGRVRKPRVARPLYEAPTAWPESLRPNASLHPPPNDPRLSVVMLMAVLGAVRNARELKSSPATWPAELILVAHALPRSSVAGLIPAPGAVRNE